MVKRRTPPTSADRCYGKKSRSEHRVVAIGHGMRPTYSTRVRRVLTRLFR